MNESNTAPITYNWIDIASAKYVVLTKPIALTTPVLKPMYVDKNGKEIDSLSVLVHHFSYPDTEKPIEEDFPISQFH